VLSLRSWQISSSWNALRAASVGISIAIARFANRVIKNSKLSKVLGDLTHGRHLLKMSRDSSAWEGSRGSFQSRKVLAPTAPARLKIPLSMTPWLVSQVQGPEKMALSFDHMGVAESDAILCACVLMRSGMDAETSIRLSVEPLELPLPFFVPPVPRSPFYQGSPPSLWRARPTRL
jgi:hypothetical protein